MDSNGIQAVPPPLTARLDILPPWLRLKRERAVRDAARSTLFASDTINYPPNSRYLYMRTPEPSLTSAAPDRPAPLSVKSRRSQISNTTTMPKRILRSVSTPGRTRAKDNVSFLPEKTPKSTAESTEIHRFYHDSGTESLHKDSSDVFSDTKSKPQGHANPFTARLNDSGDKRHGTPGRYMQNESTSSPLMGQFQLDASDVASNLSCETCNSTTCKGKDFDGKGSPYDGGVIGDETFDGLESYVDTEDEDKVSVLESVSTTSDEEGQTLYQFIANAPIPRSKTVVAGLVSTLSKRHLAAESHCKTENPSLDKPPLSFHRPLPLRSYESEATMFLTAGAQAYPGRNRSKSVTSIVNNTKGTTYTMAHPILPASSHICRSIDHIGQGSPKRDSPHHKISEQIDLCPVSSLQYSSHATTLASFPIPPMVNPVGELPILVSRAATSPPVLHPALSQHFVGTTSLEETYRAITKVNMTAILQRTRARGEQLRIVDWEQLNSFEQAWRKVNGVLLVTIYGRQDVVLDASDIAYIDCVAAELRNASNDADPMVWIRRMFEDRI